MATWSAIPFVKFFVACAIGILFHEYFLSGVWVSPVIGLSVVVLGGGAWWISGKKANFTWRQVAAAAFLLVVALTGIYRKQAKEVIFQADHISNVEGEIDFYQCVLVSDPVEKTNTWAFDAEVLQLLSDDTLRRGRGLVQIYLKKDKASVHFLDTLKYGAVLWVRGRPDEIRPLRNPGGFDFRLYMSRKGIHFQDYITREEIKYIGSGSPNIIVGAAMRWRRQLIRLLHHYLPNVEERSIAEALILGQKDEIDIEQRRAYAAAGAMHILAVSGLHVGIIYMIVAMLLKPLERRAAGKVVRLVTLFVCLWGFAFITGLSASVLRAVTMFSIVLVAESVGRKTNIYNSLALAAFLLLLYDPNFLFHVGYQLSFLAVLGIVYLQPSLYRLWAAPHWFLDKIWAITCVSIAAQLATAPLSIYYFNQFPTWFLLSNLLVIPAAFLILSTGIALFFVHFFSAWLAGWVGAVLELLVAGLNSFVGFIEGLPLSQIFPIAFSATQTWLLYILFFLLLCWWHTRRYQWFRLAAFVFTLFILSKAWLIVSRHEKNELVIYEMTGYTALDYQTTGRVFHYFDEAFKKEERLYNLNVRPHLIEEGTLAPFVSHAGNWLPATSLLPDTLVAVSAGNLKVFHLTRPLPRYEAFQTPLTADLLLVSNNSLWPGDLQKYFSPAEVVFDGTNRYSYLQRVVAPIQKQVPKVYVIPWSGAYIRQLP